MWEEKYLDDDHEEERGRVFPEHWRLTFRGEMVAALVIGLLFFPVMYGIIHLLVAVSS